MKLFALCFALFAASALAQTNYSVRYLSMAPAHEFNSPPGCPTNWPVVVDFIGSSTDPKFTNQVVISQTDLNTLRSNLTPAFQLWYRDVYTPAVLAAAATEERALRLGDAWKFFDESKAEFVLIRAAFLTVLNEINVLRARLNDLSTNPAAVYPGMAPRTTAQFRTAIQTSVNAEP